MKTFNHVMIDLETFGTTPGCVLRSVGAVFFNPFNGETKDEFYANFTEEDQILNGAFIDPETEKWWATQKEAEGAFTDKRDTKEVLMEFVDFLKRGDIGKLRIWSQGSNYDGVLLENTMRKFDITPPWKFYNTRDTRTLYDSVNFNAYWVKRTGTYHNALDDAKHQIKCVTQAYRKIYC